MLIAFENRKACFRAGECCLYISGTSDVKMERRVAIISHIIVWMVNGVCNSVEYVDEYYGCFIEHLAKHWTHEQKYIPYMYMHLVSK